MAQRGVQPESMSCSICLEVMKDPVTTPCGHSYCMKCIQAHWDQQSFHYCCPQCRKSFRTRPDLVKNTVLADLVDHLQKTGLTVAPADHCFAGPGDVSCDSCAEAKLKAVKTCLQCLASYCENHIQPHYRSSAFKTHQLVAPSHHLQNYICSVHNKVMELFCSLDQQFICSLCSVDQHKGHHTVSAAAERAQRQRELGARRDQLFQTIQDKETYLQRLTLQAKALRPSAQEAVQCSGESFTPLVLLLERRRSEVEQHIWSQLEIEEAQFRELQDKLQQDITELKSTLNDMDSLSLTEDNIDFLHRYLSLPTDREAADQPQSHKSPRPSFEQIPATVSKSLYQLQVILTDGLDNVSQALSQVQDLLLQPEPRSREEFLQYHTEMTLDPNTAHSELVLSEETRRVTFVLENQSYPDHPDRFSHWEQVLSRESLTGRCYFEVEWSGSVVYIALAYKTIQRKAHSKESAFGLNDKSWALDCDKMAYKFFHNDMRSRVLGPAGSRIGVFLDHGAGVLSFYSVRNQNMTLLHRVQTTFTQPLYAGLRVEFETTAAFCNIR